MAADYRLGYRSDIEGLRAVAILLVVAAHAGVPWLGGGFVGVDVFFVLSGFLITGLLVKEISVTGSLRFVDFYIRRLRRLLPALLLMLVVCSLLAMLLLAPMEQTQQSMAAAAAIAWFSNIHFALERLDYFSAGTSANLFLHTWSLGVEEQFYLIWPALVYFLLRKKVSDPAIGHLKMVLTLVFIASLGFCVALTYSSPQMAFYLMPLRAWQFAVGALIWLWTEKETPQLAALNTPISTAHWTAWIGWIGLGALLGAGIAFKPDMSYPGLYALIPTVGTACILVAGMNIRSNVRRLLSWRPMQEIGRISYSWYLWHWPMLLLGLALTGSNAPVYRAGYVAVSLLLAVISYRCVEAPVRHQRWWLTHQRSAIYGALALIILASAGFIGWYGRADDASQSPGQRRFVEATVDEPTINRMGCDDWYHSDRVKRCTFGPNDAPHTVVLLGDSIAQQWFPAVQKIFSKIGWRLIVLNKSACPMVEQPYFYAKIGREYTECSTWRRGVVKEVSAIKPDILLLSSAATYGFTETQWVEGTRKILQPLSTMANDIYVLRATPHLPFAGPDCLAEYAGRPSWLMFGQGCSTALKDDSTAQVYGWLQASAAGLNNVSFIDANKLICPNGICDAERNGTIIFRDSQHITATYAASLAPALEGYMQRGLANASSRAISTAASRQ